MHSLSSMIKVRPSINIIILSLKNYSARAIKVQVPNLYGYFCGLKIAGADSSPIYHTHGEIIWHLKV